MLRLVASNELVCAGCHYVVRPGQAVRRIQKPLTFWHHDCLVRHRLVSIAYPPQYENQIGAGDRVPATTPPAAGAAVRSGRHPRAHNQNRQQDGPA